MDDWTDGLSHGGDFGAVVRDLETKTTGHTCWRYHLLILLCIAQYRAHSSSRGASRNMIFDVSESSGYETSMGF